MPQKLLQYAPLILISVLFGVLITLVSFEKNPAPIIQEFGASDNAEKRIIIDLQEKTAFLCEKDKIKNTLEIKGDEIEEMAFSLSSGAYSLSNLSSFSFFSNELFQSTNPSASVLVLNDTEIKPRSSVDNQNSYFLKNEKEKFNPPGISARSALVGDIDTGAIIFSKNQNDKLAIASITKLMTALVSAESLNQYKNITITKEMLFQGYGDYGNLRRNEKLTTGELIYPLLLESSNDAAVALATDYGTEKFMKLMNEKAEELNLLNTFFEEPSGISANNVSTSHDLFQLSQYLYKNKRGIFDITKLKSVNYWRNNNFFAGNKNYLGGKNGYTDEAGETSIAIFSSSLSKLNNRNIAIVLLKSKDRETDTQSLLRWLEAKIIFHEKITPEKQFSLEETRDIRNSLKELSFMFVGDIMLDRDIKESVIKNGAGNFSFIFEKAGFLSDNDLTFGNLEGPASDIGKDVGNLYSFRMHPAVINALKKVGFNALSVANNHAGDWGKNAFEDTVERLENENIAPVNAKLNIIEKNGVKIGLLGFSDIGPKWLEISINENFSDIIKNASEKTNILILSLHFGEEYKNVTERQKQLSHLAIDNGAKIVIGHHPHIIQGTEEYKDGFIAYSLGNFVFDQTFSEETMKGLALKIIISGDGKIKSINKNIIKINKFYQPELAE